VKKFIKAVTATALSAVILFTSAPFVHANDMGQTAPQYLPLRTTFENAGANVDWEDGQVTVAINSNTWVFTPDSGQATLNDTEVSLTSPVVLTDDHIAMISLHDAATVFGDTGEFPQTVMTAIETSLLLMETLNVPGLSLAFVDAETGFMWTQGLGFADSINNIRADEHTQFQIGSTSKPFTAIAIMQLVEQGIIDLDEPLVTYIPEFSMLPSIRFGGNSDDITVRMLLSNTSGVSSNYARGFISTGGHYQAPMNGGLLEWLTTRELLFAPGTAYEYANVGWTLLGILAARMSNHTNYFEGFEQLTNENIFAPLGMNRTSFLIPNDMTNVAMSYLTAGAQDAFHIIGSPTSAGSMFSTAHDMARFMYVMLGDGSIDGHQVLPPATIAYMKQDHAIHTPIPGIMDAYGLGFLQWNPVITNGIPTVGHGGNIIHHHTEMIFSTENNLGVFVSSNSITGAAVVTPIATAILESAILEKNGYVNRIESRVSFDSAATPTTLSDEALEAFINQFGGHYFFDLAGLWSLTLEDGILTFSSGDISIELTPMSDGTFDTMIGRYSFEVIGDSVMATMLGDMTLAGARIDNIEDFAAPEDFAQWVGVYHFSPQIPNETWILSQITVDVNEIGMAMFTMVHAVSGAAGVPLDYFEGRWFLGFEPVTFTMSDDGTAMIEFMGGYFVR